MSDTRWAEAFHETYERLAPEFGYETRADTKVFDPNSRNGKLMIAVCNEVVSKLLTRSRQATLEFIEKMRCDGSESNIDAQSYNTALEDIAAFLERREHGE